jgi:hypothetical protein
MLKVPTAAITALLMCASGAHAQSHPYAALQERPIKALSADDIAGLRAGRGMAMALPAELNRYPGPMHVLDHAAKLALTPEQRQEITRQFAAMQAAAIPLGEQIIAHESALEALFRSGGAESASIDRLTAEIATLYGQLRAVHLRTHLATRATLSEPQLAMYQTLRGYDGGGASPPHKH